jgi:hypothetical protein
MRNLFAIGVIGLVLSGCTTRSISTYVPQPPPKVEAIKVPEVDVRELLPLVVGSQWTYQLGITLVKNNVESHIPDMEVTYRVVSSENVGGEIHAILELCQNGKPSDRQKWIVNSQGLFQASAGLTNPQTGELKDIPFDPPQLIMPLHSQPGQKFSWHGRGVTPDQNIDTMNVATTILDSERVDSPMGPFASVPVESVTKDSQMTTTNVTWFHPGLGIVRFRQEMPFQGGQQIQTLKLRNYALKHS